MTKSVLQQQLRLPKVSLQKWYTLILTLAQQQAVGEVAAAAAAMLAAAVQQAAGSASLVVVHLLLMLLIWTVKMTTMTVSQHVVHN
jgi:hypothetical protein